MDPWYSDREQTDRRARLTAHGAECDACRETPAPVDRIAALLDHVTVDLDPAVLSRRVLVQLQPMLHRRALAATWRRVALGVLSSLVPLVAVLAYDAYFLSTAYDLLSAILPATFAAYLIASYAAFLVLLFSATYAAIPLLVARWAPAPQSSTPYGLSTAP